jgi:hypothetical protein
MLENTWREIECRLDISRVMKARMLKLFSILESTPRRREVASRSQTSPLIEVMTPLQNT